VDGVDRIDPSRQGDQGNGKKRKTVSRLLFRAAGRPAESRPADDDTVTVGTMIVALGDRSFGWTMLLFALVNMVPMPIGSTLITAVPLMLLSGQMALGFRHIRLPEFVSRISVGRRRFKSLVLRLKPALRRIERVVRPRLLWLFSRRNERLVGAVLFAVACALFIPLPGSGFIPATALLISSIGLVERDGLVLSGGLVLGAVSIVITIAVAGAVIAGFEALSSG
jgi:hypothetical protein